MEEQKGINNRHKKQNKRRRNKKSHKQCRKKGNYTLYSNNELEDKRYFSRVDRNTRRENFCHILVRE